MPETANGRRVVITGLGVVTPAGSTVDKYWNNLTTGVSGIGPITLCDASEFPCKVAGEVRDFDPGDYIERKAARRMERFTQFMVGSAAQAITDSGIDFDNVDRDRVGVLVGNGGGGYPLIQAGAETIRERGGMKLDPLYFPKTLGNMAGAQVALQYNLRGYNGTIVTACAAGTQAIGEAMMLIRHGRADVVVTGGCEAGITELGLAGFSVMRALSTNPDPLKASRPFDLDRDGFVPCEGAGALLLESRRGREGPRRPHLRRTRRLWLHQ